MTPEQILHETKYNATKTAALLGMSREHFSRLLKAGKVPQPVNIAGQRRWLESQLTQWLADQNPQLEKATQLQKSAANITRLRKAS